MSIVSQLHGNVTSRLPRHPDDWPTYVYFFENSLTGEHLNVAESAQHSPIPHAAGCLACPPKSQVRIPSRHYNGEPLLNGLKLLTTGAEIGSSLFPLGRSEPEPSMEYSCSVWGGNSDVGSTRAK